ncbi:hypothetical protein I6G69_25475 [Bacteroides thetaiotaomicron]|nr:hypothetical protein [Bacteroides thetaiotaomicron]MBI0306253.1 hypothetical protein [Bacteroides thetaiotaomicron]
MDQVNQSVWETITDERIIREKWYISHYKTKWTTRKEEDNPAMAYVHISVLSPIAGKKDS